VRCLLILAGALVSSSFAPSTSLACASCGSGGDDPLILYPNQDWRFYLAASRSFGFKTVKSDGKLGEENAPTFKDAFTMAVGKAMTPTSFVTLTVPYLQNWKDGTYKRAYGDPIIATRWTLVTQDISDPRIPQVQWMASHRFAQARAQQEGTHPNRLDVFGSGVPESKLGLDLFQGMTDFKMGAAFSLLFPGERQLGGQASYPGLGSRSMVTLGYGKTQLGKILLGITRDTRQNRKTNGVEVKGSRVIENGFFITTDAEITDSQMLRFTWSHKSSFWDSRNGSRNHAVTLAWLYGISHE